MSSSGWEPPASEQPGPSSGGWSPAPAPVPPPANPYPPPAGPAYGYGYAQPQPVYGTPTYGYATYQRPTTDALAMTALGFALASWACAPFLALVALPLASSAKKRIVAANGMLLGDKMVLWARVVAVANLAVAGVTLAVLAANAISGLTGGPG